MPVFCNEHTFLFSCSMCQMLMHFVGFYPASTQWMSPCSFVLKVYNVTFLCFSGACSYPVYLHLLFARHTGLGCPFGPKHLPDKCQIVLRQKRDKFFFFFSVICGHFGGYGLTLHSESDCDVTSSACYRPVSVGLEITAMAGGP